MKTNARFILSKSKALKQYNIIKKLCDEVSYSFKTNYDVGRVLADNTDTSFSVHSIDTVKLLENPARFWFFAQAWNLKEINHLVGLGVRRFVVDNRVDLDELLRFLNENEIRTNLDLMLRMKLKENTIHTGKNFVFGMRSGEVNELIPKLKQNPKIGKLGVHFHRKTQNISEWSLKYELGQALKEETMQDIDILNIGGGIPSKYKNYRREVLDYITNKIKELKVWLKDYDIRLIIEPGRFIAAYCVDLEAEIKNIYDNNIIVDCSVYNSAMDTFVSHFRLLVKGELPEDDMRGRPYTIKGSTPCSMDIFRYRAFLENPKKGNKIIFKNAGAYNYQTNFCSLKQLPTVIID